MLRVVVWSISFFSRGKAFVVFSPEKLYWSNCFFPLIDRARAEHRCRLGLDGPPAVISRVLGKGKHERVVSVRAAARGGRLHPDDDESPPHVNKWNHERKRPGLAHPKRVGNMG